MNFGKNKKDTKVSRFTYQAFKKIFLFVILLRKKDIVRK